MIRARTGKWLPVLRHETSLPCYVADQRPQTNSAADQAARVAEWVRAGTTEGHKLDEKSLFEALYTCACRATLAAQEEHSALATQNAWTNRWNTIRTYLVEQNLGLAHSLARQFARRDVHENDLLSDALYALIRAVDGFNARKGYRFSTYACNAIARALAERRRGEEKYRRRFTTYPDLRHLGPIQTVSRSDFQAAVCTERLKHILAENRAHLSGVEIRVLAQRFPLQGTTPRSLWQTAQIIGLSRERVRQIQNIALGKLRKALNEDLVMA